MMQTRATVTRRGLLSGAMLLMGRTALAQGRGLRRKFTVYDALLFDGKPNLRAYGIRPDFSVPGGWLWPPGTTDFSEPNEAATRETAEYVASSGYAGPVQLDIEHWYWDIRYSSTATVDVSLAKLRQVLAWFKDEAPGLDLVGYYALVPIRDYWTPVQFPQDLPAWHAANDYLRPLSRDVDAFYPSLYTFYNDPAGWVVYAQANIAEAQRISGGKPVYPFIWPQYHSSAGPLAYTYIDYAYWKQQLSTIRNAGANGIILWGGYQTPWDATQGWWQATKEFMRTL
jgi:hypothetical protein